MINEIIYTKIGKEIEQVKIAAYQFAVSNSIDKNFNEMKYAITQADEKKVRMLIFPECALSGYPPYVL